jgi:putative nucleotidyltransferase with HDIG domain
MEKKILHPQPRILMIEDENGMQSSYYPGLTWNGLGYSFPSEQHAIPVVKENPILLPRLSFMPQEARESDLSFVDVDRSKKIYSAKNILRDISRQYESANRDYSFASDGHFLENQTYLHSSLLHLIAATDGNEDTVGHSQLVARFTLLLTKTLGIGDRTFSVEIERGALLHDIGKIGIPDSILRKPGPLTDNEKEIIKEHPYLGYEMVEEFFFLRKASRVVLFHHESYDGRGYPYGLSGEEIPLEARIFAIADTLDAITSDRPYRKGQSFRAAFDEIERVRGSQFDPCIVDALLSVPEEKWQQIKSDAEQSLSRYSIH